MKNILLSFIFALFFVACLGKVPQKASDEHVKYVSQELYSWLSFDFIHYAKRSDGLLEFEARFVNDTYKDKMLSYRVFWRDANGLSEDTVLSKWKDVKVNGKKELIIRGISPNAKSSEFSLHLQRYAK